MRLLVPLASLMGLALLAVAAGACSSSSASTTASDAGADDGATAVTLDPLADWSCLGKVVEASATAATAEFAFQAVDPFTNKGLPGATVKSCAATDTACASPFETLASDGDGKVTFKSLPTPGKGFDGFFQVQVGSDLPNLDFEGHPITGNYGNYGRTTYGEAQLATLLQTAETKVTFDPSRGVVGIQVHDCSQYPGGTSCRDKACKSYNPGGVVFSIDVQDPGIVVGYLSAVDGKVGLSTKATSTSALVGLGGFVNVPPGPVTITAKVAATGQTVGTYKMFSRAGAFAATVALPQ
jgi:hypothetical protein